MTLNSFQKSGISAIYRNVESNCFLTSKSSPILSSTLSVLTNFLTTGTRVDYGLEALHKNNYSGKAYYMQRTLRVAGREDSASPPELVVNSSI
jgi:hypothetical protein